MSHARLVGVAKVRVAVGLCGAVFSKRSNVTVLIDLVAGSVHRVELVFAEVVHDSCAYGVAKNVDGSPVKIIARVSREIELLH